jgi:isopentenyldiphosphate isomerase
MIRIWPHRTYGVVILFLLVSFLHYYFWHVDNAVVVLSSSSIETTAKKQQPEFVATYTFPPPPEKLNTRENDVLIPHHLTPVNPSTLIPNGSYPIDVAHRRGYLHTGHCLFIMDASGLFLFLKRSSDVVTCPSTWSILGEHSIANEEARDTVVRGMEEELGLKQQQVVRREANDDYYYGEIDSSSSFTAEFQTIDKNIIHVAIQNITQYPLYYIRRYGPRLDNRIDSQVTYLWLARLPKRHEEIHIKLDEEVADHKWISLTEFSNWIEADAARDNDDKEVKQHPLDGIRDDGPPNGDFCHHTIRSLYAKGLDHLKLMLL